MMAFKGVTQQLSARSGKGIYQFEIGRTERTDKSKTASCGFHCCENPFDCLGYYHLKGDRFLIVEAAGSIDEDDHNRIACTELTPVRELTIKEFAGYGMQYLIQHPMRKSWEQAYQGCKVKKEKAVAENKNDIAIARGKKPIVKGAEGSVLGIILEPEVGSIVSARLFVPNRQQAGKWYTINENRELVEVGNEV